jgi:SAM-dependent MidA family methyltransferase
MLVFEEVQNTEDKPSHLPEIFRKALRAENLTRYKTRETIGKSADFVSAITSTYISNDSSF